MNVPKTCLSQRTGWAVLTLGLCLTWAGADAAAPSLATGANVDESRVQNVYHVDVASADAANDDKHGTADAPFATISYACEAAARDQDKNIGVKVVVAPGVYRETVEIRPAAANNANIDAPFVIESAERGQAVIDGADTEGWTVSTWKSDGTHWFHPWPFRRNPAQQAVWTRGLHAAAAPPSANGEAYHPGDLVLVDGNVMRQVNRQEDLVPGCFWGRAAKSPSAAVDSPDGAAVFLSPPPDAALASSIVQIGVREHGLVIRGRRNVVVRGLLFQHVAGPAAADDTAAGLRLDGCSNVVIDDVLSQWNDGSGLVITGRASAPWSTDFTLRQSHLLHNGGSGLIVANVKNLLVEDTEACFNNFRGEWASWVDAAGPAGVKTSGVHQATWRRLRAVGNFCRGVWWNDDNADVTMEDGALRANVLGGLLIERDPGPVLVRRCLVAETKSLPGVREENAWAGGISLVATPDVTLESNIVAANAGTQLGCWEDGAHAEDTNFENRAAKRTLRAEHHVYHHNVFFATDPTQNLAIAPTVEVSGKASPSNYYGTLDARENCFWNPSRADVFSLHGGSPKFAAASPVLDFERWRALAKEIGSSWQDPLLSDPSEGDYRPGEHSPAADWNLPTDEGAATP